MTTHTPGPWHLPCFASNGPCSCTYVLSEHQAGMGAICHIPHGEGDEPFPRAVANARLIVAAPDLFAALQTLQANPNDPRAHRIALDALAKVQAPIQLGLLS